ncbi:MAG: DUF2330 domain-containing protein [Myxococcota bacterium]
MLALWTLSPATAFAFCGFYVGGADASLYNDATMVVLMREGTRTVLSMQNTYAGPPEDFALVIPVPEVLQQENVRTLPEDVFQRVDRLAAPRLVEYWEQDPCRPRDTIDDLLAGALGGSARPNMRSQRRARNLGVEVEAEFAVGEYDIVVLSASQSDGLERWLHEENYRIPRGASTALAPYVQLGTKFFVAKVDPQRVRFENGRAILSPLRFHYTAEHLTLPVRLGLLNSRGEQDLIVHILSRSGRFEAANYANVTIPSNLVVQESVRDNFGTFYRKLFDRVHGRAPNAVVTEYSWSALNCDPCPSRPLGFRELALLGADVIGQSATPFRGSGGWTLTRLHHRYGADGVNRDLVFREAPPIVGGRGVPNQRGRLREQAAEPFPGGPNNFQGRYVMLHHFDGAITCDSPRRGIWGGRPGGVTPSPPSLRPLPRTSAHLRDFLTASNFRYLRVRAEPAARPNLGQLPRARPRSSRTPPPAPANKGNIPEARPHEYLEETGADGEAGCSAHRTSLASTFVLLAFVLLRRQRRAPSRQMGSEGVEE